MLVHLKLFSSSTRKQKYRRSLTFIPYFFTYLNAICGFLSIIKSIEGEYYTAAYYIMLAALMDAVDGRLARALGSTSYFGMELDSLCDAVSFCLAPGVLLYSWFDYADVWSFKLILVLYLCAGLARLAKFNLPGQKQTAYFSGLPTPFAAFFVSSLVLCKTWLIMHGCGFIYTGPVLCFLIGISALLMISTVPFPAFKHYRLRMPQDYCIAVLGLVVCAWAVLQGYPITLGIIALYSLLACIYCVKN